MNRKFNTVSDAIRHLQNGGFIILSDNESRENEGDLVALADKVSPQTIHEMLKEANGLMCVPVNKEIAHRLGFKDMVAHSTDPNQTPFMITVDGNEEKTGVTTGVSAFDRAATIHRIANPDATAGDFNHPGHIQPLIAKTKGIRERTGHTEASVDLAYLSNSAPVTVIIEVLKEDGHMARRDDLFELADKLRVPYITIGEIADFMDEHHVEYAAELEPLTLN